MGPLSGPEIRRSSQERLRKTRGFTPGAARLIADVVTPKNADPDFGDNAKQEPPEHQEALLRLEPRLGHRTVDGVTLNSSTWRA